MNLLEIRSKGDMDRSISSVNKETLLQYNRNTNEKRRTIEIKIYFAPALENCEDYDELEETSTRLDGIHTFVTDLVPSEIACFDNSPGRIRRTAV